MSRKQIGHAAHGAWRPKACCFLDFWTYTLRRPADAALVWEPGRLCVLALFSPPRTSSSLSSIKLATLLDRLLHRCDIIENRNDSWRFKTRQDDHALTVLATSPQLRPAPASRTSPTRLVAKQIKIEADRLTDN